jgi:hypothetical protein
MQILLLSEFRELFSGRFFLTYTSNSFFFFLNSFLCQYAWWMIPRIQKKAGVMIRVVVEALEVEAVAADCLACCLWYLRFSGDQGGCCGWY